MSVFFNDDFINVMSNVSIIQRIIFTTHLTINFLSSLNINDFPNEEFYILLKGLIMI